jgi:hypothetical protein
VKIGLLKTLAPQTMIFWEHFIKELGLEVILPELSNLEAMELGAGSLPEEASFIQLMVGQALELVERSQVIAVPQLELDNDLQDNPQPWLIDPVGVLARRLSMGNVTALTVYGDAEEIRKSAFAVGNKWTHSPAVVKRAWEKSAHLLKRPHVVPQMILADQANVLVIAAPMLLEEGFLLANLPQVLQDTHLHPTYSHSLEHKVCLDFYPRTKLELSLDLERAQAGAQALLEGKAATKGILYVVAQGDAAGLMFARKLQRIARKPTLILPVHPDGFDTAALEQFASSVRG